MARYAKDSPTAAVAEIPRSVFLTEIWQYKAGEHVSFIGPTNSGKTYFALPLLARSVTEDLPGFITVMKPKDDTVSQFLAANKWRRAITYPPTPSVRQKPPGWAIWPIHTTDPEADEYRHEEIFRRLHRDRYIKGDSIIFDDEAVSLVREMNLKKDLVRIWTKGRSMGCGLWAATQRPSLVPLEMYDQAEHLFLAYDPDERNQERFGEIGGVNPDLVKQVVAQLPKFHWLYIRRTDRVMCVVGP